MKQALKFIALCLVALLIAACSSSRKLEKNTDKVLMAIEASKKNEPQRLLTGLGIPGIGRTAALQLLTET